VGTPGPTGELVRAASEYAVRVAAAVAEDPPTGEDLARDFERFLREQGEEPGQ